MLFEELVPSCYQNVWVELFITFPYLFDVWRACSDGWLLFHSWCCSFVFSFFLVHLLSKFMLRLLGLFDYMGSWRIKVFVISEVNKIWGCVHWLISEAVGLSRCYTRRWCWKTANICWLWARVSFPFVDMVTTLRFFFLLYKCLQNSWNASLNFRVALNNLWELLKEGMGTFMLWTPQVRVTESPQIFMPFSKTTAQMLNSLILKALKRAFYYPLCGAMGF